MRCDYDKLSLYVDDELDKVDIIEFEEHLLECKDCKADLELLLQLKKELRYVNPYDVPDNFHDDLMKNIKPKKTWYKYCVGLAASLLVVVGSYSLYAGEISNEPELMMTRHLGEPVANVLWEVEAVDKAVVEELKFYIDSNSLNITYFEDTGQIHLITFDIDDYLDIGEYINSHQDFTSIIPPANLPSISDIVINYPLD